MVDKACGLGAAKCSAPFTFGEAFLELPIRPVAPCVVTSTNDKFGRCLVLLRHRAARKIQPSASFLIIQWIVDHDSRYYHYFPM